MFHFRPEDEILDVCEKVSITTAKKIMKIAKTIAESKADEKLETFFKKIRESGFDIGIIISKYIIRTGKKV